MGMNTQDSSSGLLGPSGSSQNVTQQRVAHTDKKDINQSRYQASNMYAAQANESDAYSNNMYG